MFGCIKKVVMFIGLVVCSVQVHATNYYVKATGSDSNTGLTDALAWQTLSKVNSTTFQAGDTIFFRRGDTFRGSLYQTESGTANNWIVYTAYGTGNKPLILGSKDISAAPDWTLHSGNVWRTSATLGTNQDDISNLIFNNEQSVGMKKKSMDSLNVQGKFYFNPINDYLYLYSVESPALFYTKIEAAGHHDISQGLLYWINSNYIKVMNLDVRYSSGAGIEARACNGFVVESCDVSYIGGEYLEVSGTNLIRLGNGISFAQTNDSVFVRYCRVSQCFDAGISPQAWSASSMTNMWFYENIISNCWYSYETWCSPDYTLTNIHFYNNTCYDAGDVWSNSIHQRPDLNNARHVIMWALTGNASNITIRNNIFKDCTSPAMRIDDNIAKVTLDYNLYDVANVGYMNELDVYPTLANWRTATGQESHSMAFDPQFTSTTTFAIASTSPAKDAGINLGLTRDFAGGVIPSGAGYDIGAYEFQEPSPVQDRLLQKRGVLLYKRGNLLKQKRD